MKHLSRAIDGQNQGWKYLVVIVVALLGGQFIGAIPFAIVMGVTIAMKGSDFVPPENKMDFAAYGIDPSLGLVLVVIPFILTLVLAVVLVKSFHKRNLKDVINGGSTFRWKHFCLGVGVWGAIIVVITFVGVLMEPDNFEFQFAPLSFFPLVFVALIFLPIQSGTEEYLVRGYLAQGVGAWTKRPWLVILLPSIFFTLLHVANPEVKEYGFWVMMPQYFTMAVTFAIITILDDGIELAIGTHAINNCLGAIMINNKDSAIQTQALFMQKEVDPQNEFWVLLISSVLMITVFASIFKWDFKVLLKKIEVPEITP